MQICEYGHEPIVYEDRQCPLCEAMTRIEDLERENERLQDLVAELEEQLETLGEADATPAP